MYKTQKLKKTLIIVINLAVNKKVFVVFRTKFPKRIMFAGQWRNSGGRGWWIFASLI